jgi:hypothetical protein
MANTRAYNLTNDERVLVFTALSRFCNTPNCLQLIKQFEQPIPEQPEEPVWRTLPAAEQTELFNMMIEEIGDSVKEFAIAELDGHNWADLCEVAGFDEDLVEHLCYADPTEVREHVIFRDADVTRLQAYGMFDASIRPTKRCQRWLEEFIGKAIDFAKAKEFVS